MMMIMISDSWVLAVWHPGLMLVCPSGSNNLSKQLLKWITKWNKNSVVGRTLNSDSEC